MRLKLEFPSIKSASAGDGKLRIEVTDGIAVFELGANAAKWLDKILHPKTRIEKLGIKSNAAVSLAGTFDADFLAELRAATKNVSNGKVAADAEWIFLAAESPKDLSHAGKFAKQLKGAAALWIVYPKGQKQITEKDVIDAGRRSGLKDVKVVGFSATHTALKFVIPVDKR